MYCPNCGTGLNGEEDFCPNCGTNIKQFQEQASILASAPNPLEEEQEQAKLSFIEKCKLHKKFFLFMGIGLLLSFLVIIVYILFGNIEKLSWDNRYEAIQFNYVTQSKVTLGIQMKEEKKEELQYGTTCGEVVSNDLELVWDLTDSLGECELTVSYKRKKLKKRYTVLSTRIPKEELTFEEDIDLDSEEDLDYDGLTNKQEQEYGTNPLLLDSDMDGLTDYEEIFTYKTDPNKKDTDYDGLNDYDEIRVGLDPLKSDSKGDGIKDGERDLTYNYTSDKCTMTIKGKGNIASTVVEVTPNTKISNKVGLMDQLFTFYTEGSITEAITTISYTKEELEKYGLKEDNLSIYYYNEKEAKYEEIQTDVDKEKKTLTATLKHFSSYVIGDTSLVKKETNTQVLFVLDNSWSMYSSEQYEEITGKKYTGGLFSSSDLDASDIEGKRFTLTSTLISKIENKNYQIGLSEFRQDYKNAFKIGSNVEEIKSSLKNMSGNFITKTEGTNISNALTGGIAEFSKDSDNNFLILLTDGQDMSLSTSLVNNSKKIIEKATANHVKICAIGFGEGSSNTELANISNATGCKFYSSSNVDGLTELFANIEMELNDDLVDIDEDGEMDGLLIADSGFIVNRDGFSFENYGTNLSRRGHCYGMATFAEFYYKKQLPLQFESKTVKEDTSYAYDLTNTYFKNYDNLYDYQLKTNALKYAFGFDLFGEEMPTDLKTVENDSLIYNSKYNEEILNSGLYEYGKEEKKNLTSDEQMKQYGFTYSTYVDLLFNEDKMQTSKIIDNDDKQMFNAIYASFIKQRQTSYYSSGMDFTLWLRNALEVEKINYTGKEGFIHLLKSRLDDEDAPVIVTDFSGHGLHAVNAISLVQDIDNPNYYYIGVYDNNYPGEKRYLELECNQKTCLTRSNDYYAGSNQPVRMSASLAVDLAYFK